MDVQSGESEEEEVIGAVNPFTVVQTCSVPSSVKKIGPPAMRTPSFLPHTVSCLRFVHTGTQRNARIHRNDTHVS